MSFFMVDVQWLFGKIVVNYATDICTQKYTYFVIQTLKNNLVCIVSSPIIRFTHLRKFKWKF